jgi:hypothetical protein
MFFFIFVQIYIDKSKFERCMVIKLKKTGSGGMLNTQLNTLQDFHLIQCGFTDSR